MVVLDVHGVGYRVEVPLSTYDRINPVEGKEVTLLTELIVREDAHLLYGFATDAERDLFRLLVERVSGIGPATALAVIGSLGVEEFKAAVASQDVKALTRAKGLGKKTAERIILELKDKVGVVATWQQVSGGQTSAAASDAELALLALGYKQLDTRKVLGLILAQDPAATTDALIRQALRALNS